MRGYTGAEPSLDEPDYPMDEATSEELGERYLVAERLVVQTITRRLDEGNEPAARAMAYLMAEEMVDEDVADGWFRRCELFDRVWDAVLDEEVGA
jgi:hypothetical protein